MQLEYTATHIYFKKLCIKILICFDAKANNVPLCQVDCLYLFFSASFCFHCVHVICTNITQLLDIERDQKLFKT
jgi:hypothetical protein